MVRSRSARRPIRSAHQPRRRSLFSGSFIGFLLVASFGILFAGCGAPPPEDDTFTFTEQDVARFRELAGDAQSSAMTASGVEMISAAPVLVSDQQSSLPTLDLSMAKTYDSIRSGPAATGEDLFRVTNAYLNVRTAPKISASEVDRLNQGDLVTVLDFVDAAWAKVALASGKEGYVSSRYIAKLVAEEELQAARKKYEGTYFVDFGFLNVRNAADAGSEKIGELPGQALVRPISMDKVWARVPFGDKEGYVAVQYLSPFVPQFLVRQVAYRLPMLHYRLGQEGNVLSALQAHLAALKAQGVTIWTLRDLRQLVLAQEDRDVRVPPKTVVLLVSDVTAKNVQDLSSALRGAGVSATLFIPTKELGLSGITQTTLLTLSANGFDLQSEGHTGDDLRSLTNAQVDLELQQSRALLEGATGKPVFAIGYPIGGVNDRVMERASAAGYLFGVSSAPDRTFRREQFLRLPSFIITGSMTADDVTGIALGQE